MARSTPAPSLPDARTSSVPVVLQNRQRAVTINRAWLGRTAESILAAAHAEATELSLVLVSDRCMRALNRRYRNKDRPTDVLAFPMYESCPPKRRSAAPAASVAARSGYPLPPMQRVMSGVLIGDVVISLPTAKRQAAVLGHSLRAEVARLLVHGILHLLGYDHERSVRAASAMTRKEKAILRKIR